MQNPEVPPRVDDFRKTHPEIWKAFTELAEQCHEAGPLSEKERRLVKVALCIGAALEGGTHSAVRNARSAGVAQEELTHIAVLAISTLGFPAAMRAMSWVHEEGRGRHSG